MKKISQKERGYFKQYYLDHKDYFKQRHIDSYIRKPKKDPIERSKHRDSYLKQYRKNNKEDIQKYRDKIKPHFNDYLLRRNYNITLEDYNELFIKQEGCCAICHRHQNDLKRKLSVDHNHTTEKVRGLLCDKCNLTLGNVHENIQILLNMIHYLNKEIEALDPQE